MLEHKKKLPLEVMCANCHSSEGLDLQFMEGICDGYIIYKCKCGAEGYIAVSDYIELWRETHNKQTEEGSIRCH